MRLLLSNPGRVGLVVVMIASALAWPAKSEPAPDRAALQAAINDNPYRTEAQTARDQDRHPLETLAFFGIGPDMTVVEPFPGAGWYSNILGPLVKESGRYIAVHYPPRFYSSPRRRNAQRRWAEFYVADTAKFGDKATARFVLHSERIAPLDSVDAVLLFRQMHNLAASGIDRVVLKEFFDILKPGGILGIVQHRGDEDSVHTPAQNRGYLKESYVIAVAEAVGFELAAKSEINANPADTKDYAAGVWALPPTLANGSVDRNRYLAIGESDRMTLKFIKPE